MAETTQNRSLDAVQYLRAIAALMVVYFHLVDEIPAYTAFLTAGSLIDFDRMRTGVDIFFVISGFIMVVTSCNSKPGEFLMRRAMRIAPLYWTLTFAMAAPAVVLPAILHSRHSLTVVQLVKSLLFIPFNNPDHGGEIWPVLVPGWTLNLEMYFYVIFAVLLIWRPIRGRQITVAAALFAALVALHTLTSRSSIAGFYTQPMVLEFACGMVLAYLYARGMHLPKAVSALLILLGFALILCRGGPWAGIPAVMIVSGAVGLESAAAVPRWRFAVLLGDASYSLYLTHIFALWMVRAAWPHFWHLAPGAIGATAFALFAFAAVISLALLTYRGIERPFLKGLKKLVERPVESGTYTVPQPTGT